MTFIRGMELSFSLFSEFVNVLFCFCPCLGFWMLGEVLVDP